MELYIVRPAENIDSGGTIDLSLEEASPNATIEQWFPEGVTPQGRRWATADLTADSDLTAITEWLVELARRSEFGSSPSRFQSVVGYETRESAVRVADRHDGTAQSIYQVTASDPAGPFYEGHRRGQTVPDILSGARTYWTGTPHATGEREYLIQCPVAVGDQITPVENQ